VARYLEMAKCQHLERLLDLEWPELRIARELGIHRNTVRRYAKLRRAKFAQTPTDGVEVGAVELVPVRWRLRERSWRRISLERYLMVPRSL
jgi:IS30 family transposase